MRQHTTDTGERVLNTAGPLGPRWGAEGLSKGTTRARDVRDGGRRGVKGMDGNGRQEERERMKTHPGGSRGGPGEGRSVSCNLHVLSNMGVLRGVGSLPCD